MNKSKQKGNRFERECVEKAKRQGLSAERAYASNGKALGESETVDVIILANGSKIRCQCKVRNRIAGYIKIPEGCEVTLIKEDRGEIFVVQRYEDWLSEVSGGLL
jgi:Holliday junction resolvase|tara:strand:- start:183 stop:497 length:315 start_codon:yes stop_codon:yes gene_type:complete